ncbi:MAG: hypothetical protein JWO37_1727 [Acidimicrobiales bacterium]|jgi:alkylhydroperoxidase family enzyme|nr:hypothetical protein [Acidimicrobiales bacterium]
MNLRFAGAKQQGLTEALIEQVDDDYLSSDLPSRYRLAVALTDQILNDPGPPAAAQQTELLDELTPAQVAELTLTVALASAFSRISIVWGPPADMPLLEVPTPAPGGSPG